ncbi:DUF2783 domain-containing protein [Roseateles koreensis]|uniref:DUF2783 domain-containing protein n=1 Tax=Roseateles koreensis TaxID=2987526 RepID=A0ABT5KL68_9BURK|nr:DUF2783 domain-containing protein [Roseateles koreensis]MDC8783582.1 DUF2783 domain-containing protein [Roseateles koreensis]
MNYPDIKRLIRSPNMADPDAFYEALIHTQRDLNDEQADALLARLVLVLANHIGDAAVLGEALALARETAFLPSARGAAALPGTTPSNL